MSDTAKSSTDLSPVQKRAYLAQLLREKAKTGATTRQADPEEFPLSRGQRALWFLYQLAPESTAYNLLYAATIHSVLDISALQRAARELGDPRVARGCMELPEQRAAAERPGERMLATPRSHHEHLHRRDPTSV